MLVQYVALFFLDITNADSSPQRSIRSHVSISESVARIPRYFCHGPPLLCMKDLVGRYLENNLNKYIYFAMGSFHSLENL